MTSRRCVRNWSRRGEPVTVLLVPLLTSCLAWLPGTHALAQQTPVQAVGIADRYDSLLSELIAAISAGDLPKAERLAFALTMLDEKRHEGFAALGVLYARQNNTTQAGEAFASAKKLAPKAEQGVAQLLELAAAPRPPQAEVKLPWCEVLVASPDPTVVTDEDARARLRATNLLWKVRDRKTGIVMLLVPSGTFKMGSSGQERRQAPQYIPAENQSNYERWITNGSDGSLLPVQRISWDSCQQFCELSGLRLPSESEWEYACRAGTVTTFSFGASIDPDKVNYDGDYPYGSARRKGPRPSHRLRRVARESMGIPRDARKRRGVLPGLLQGDAAAEPGPAGGRCFR